MLHNAVQRFTDLARAYRIRFGLDAGSGGIERLNESIQVVRDMTHPEDAFLLSERRCLGSLEVGAGGAGNLAAAGWNILETGWIGVLEKVWISSSAASLIYIKSRAALANTRTTKWFADNRNMGSPLAVLQDKNADALNPGTYTLGVLSIPTTVTLEVQLNYVAASGLQEPGIVIVNGTANQSLRIMFSWRERRLLPGELGL